ncbi:MAG: ATP-binding cassette domain-containing protein, partial [Bdellovibrionaceae bacterium]|nr:ATP-binding cassette domain-containing protein [Pseudobdellovibrionaceae bacterium]
MSLIKNLHYKFDGFELRADSLEIPDSGITVLQGPSGSGKSTFLNILIGLEKPKSWAWTFQGTELSVLPIEDRRLGVVFQTYDLFPHMTAEENVTLVLKA